MPKSTIFRNNRSQAVRLPKAVAFPENVKKVEVIKLGRSRLISPADHLWDDFFDGPGVSDDFPDSRNQPEMQKREAL